MRLSESDFYQVEVTEQVLCNSMLISQGLFKPHPNIKIRNVFLRVTFLLSYSRAESVDICMSHVHFVNSGADTYSFLDQIHILKRIFSSGTHYFWNKVATESDIQWH
jgi:hypothetical protein